MPTTVIEVVMVNGKIEVHAWETTVMRGDVVYWTTELREGVSIIPRPEGLTMRKETADIGSPAVALATNTGYYYYDVYWPKVETLVGKPQDPQRVVAILIVSEYIAPNGPQLNVSLGGSVAGRS